MKNFILLSALALGAMTMSGQITKVGTFNGDCRIDSKNFAMGDILYSVAEDSVKTNITIYDTNFKVYKTITINKTVKKNSAYIFQMSKRLFTNDDKICFIYFETSGYNQYITSELKVLDEDGKLVYDFEDKPKMEVSRREIPVHKLGENYYCFFYDIREFTTCIYSLPGNGQPTDLEAPTAPSRTSNARKVVENGQMYIILDGVKYAVTGTEL